MINARLSLCCAGSLTVTLLCSTARAAEPEQPSAQEVARLGMDDIVRAWDRRREEVRSGRFSWTVQRWLKKGAKGSTADGNPFATSGDPIPAEDTTFTYKHTLVFDGSKARYEWWGPLWDPHEKEFLQEHFIEVWDGTTSKLLRDDQDYPSGYPYDFFWSPTQGDLDAFKYAFRMTDPHWYGFDPAKYEVIGHGAVIDGRPCLVVETARSILREKVARGRRPLKATYWVSPGQDFGIVRFAATEDGKDLTTLEIDVKYKSDADHGWYPDHWTITWYRYLAPSTIDDAQVTEYALNVPIDPELFEFDFPEGTWVYDRRTKEKYLWQDGKKRSITQAELLRGATYDDLRRTSSGMAGLKQSGRNTRAWVIWAVAAALIAAVALIFVRRSMNNFRNS